MKWWKLCETYITEIKMTNTDFAAKRKGLGLTQKDLSRITGKAIITVASWEAARRPVPQWAVVVLEYLSKMKTPKDYKPPK